MLSERCLKGFWRVDLDIAQIVSGNQNVLTEKLQYIGLKRVAQNISEDGDMDNPTEPVTD